LHDFQQQSLLDFVWLERQAIPVLPLKPIDETRRFDESAH
jgi:hypothetical protein